MAYVRRRGHRFRLFAGFTSTHTVEDTTLALLQFTASDFSNEMIGSIFSSSALPAVSFPGEDFRIRIVGTEGLLDLDAYHELRISDGGDWHTLSTQPPVTSKVPIPLWAGPYGSL